ncbi:tail fiber domain-containing protein [Enterobacter cloacae]|uniref:tail fiber domain-containing protein n=1 Tax=Enterobacter cloacae TaxID=550 RepID=UPI001433405A|nr:tail fiber domain-containing protein [Enterobacter cloacae]MCM7497308.1 tail fiber domain-containing protein [Enterobacter cloacae]HAV2238029.1 tail fiber domain-containing protein [Enterobacter cloacae]
MSAGTITLTNGSAIVGGSGTSFATELAEGDFVVAIVGGITYTLPVKSVESPASLTLIRAFPGPTQSGAAWNAIPRATQNQLTAELVAQTTKALRGLNYDKSNWQNVFSGSDNITVKLPDGSAFSGPSWKYITDLLKNRNAANTSWSVINGDTALPGNNTALKGGDLRSVYQINGVDHMAVTLRAAGVVGGNYTPMIEQVAPSGGASLTKQWTFPQAAGELVSKAETGYTSINGKSGGTLSSAFGMSNCANSGFDVLYASNKNLGLYFEQMNVLGAGYLYPHSSFKMHWPGNYAGVFTWSAWANKSNPEYVLSWTTEATTTPHMWRFNGSNGNATATGSWVPTSDERLKNLHGPITDPLAKMQQIRGQTWNMKEGGGFGVGFTAQDVQRVFPDSVHSTGDKTLSDGTVVKDVLAPDTYGVAAGLHHEAILALLKRIEVLETKLKDK